MPTPSSRPQVLVIGCGFGGLEAIRALRRAPVDITVVDRTNHHLFQPLLYQVATAGLSAPSIAAPIRHVLRAQANVRTLLGDVQRIDPHARTVTLEDGQVLHWDHLIVAAGATHSYFGNDAWAPHAPGLKTLADAFEIRRRVLRAFEAAEREPDPARRAAWLQFVVIGAGPTGVEMAGTLAEIARRTLVGEFRQIDPASARVVLVEGAARVLQTMPPSLSESARRQLRQLGVDVLLNQRVTAIDGEGVTLQGQDGAQRLHSHCVIWAAGVAASPLGRQLAESCGYALDRAGRVQVEADLSLSGHPHISVIGDLAAARSGGPEGRPVPGVSPAAKQMGRWAAANLMRRLAGRPTLPFRYRDYGNLATIGRHSAVVDLGTPLGPLRFSGYLAWLFWLFAHVYFLIDFRSRLVVLMDWAWAYWTHERHARVISDLEARQFPPMGDGAARERHAQSAHATEP